MIKRSLITQIREGRIHIILLLMRVTAGGMMITHGWPKFKKMLSGDLSFADPLGIGEAPSLILAASSEFLGAIALVIGLLTRLNAFFLAFTMFVAGIIQHGDDPFSKKEKALLYLVVFVCITIAGPGKYSVDDRFNN